jgi:hypothetical protein
MLGKIRRIESRVMGIGIGLGVVLPMALVVWRIVELEMSGKRRSAITVSAGTA